MYRLWSAKKATRCNATAKDVFIDQKLQKMAYKFILRQIVNLYNGLFASDMLMFKDIEIKQQYTESNVTLQ